MSEKDYKIQDVVLEIANELNRSPAQVAINWMLQRKGVPSVLIGARTIEQFEDNIKSLEFKLSEEQIGKLNRESAPELIFPHNFIGTSMETCPWLYAGGKNYSITNNK